jgi:hypothetical protein
MVSVDVLFAEFAAAAVALLVYLVTYLVVARGEWYRSVFGIGQVLVCLVALAWYSKVFFGPIRNMTTTSAIFYGLFAAVFWVLAAGGLWIASGAAERRRRRIVARRQV